MTFDGPLSTIALATLVVLFGCVMRRRRHDSLLLWFAGWLFVLIHIIVQWLGIPHAGQAFTECVNIYALIFAAICFMQATSDISGGQTFWILSAILLPSLTYVGLVSTGVAAPEYLMTTVCIGFGSLICAVWTTDHCTISSRLHFTAFLVATATMMMVEISFRSPMLGVYALLAGLYAYNALLYHQRFHRLSAGVVTSVLGFLAWSMVFPVASTLFTLYPEAAIPPVVWNFPKFFVALGMMLTVLEDENESLSSAQSALRESETNHRRLVEGAPVGIYRTDTSGRILFANPALAAMLLYDSPADLLGSIITRDLAMSCRSEYLDRLGKHKAIEGYEGEWRRADGSTIIIRESAHAVRSTNGGISYFEGVIEDITERKRLHSQLLQQAYHDPLTGLPNRTLFEDRLAQALIRAQRSNSSVGVLCVDLDRFKSINDTFGHQFGDDFLQQVVCRLGARLRACDTFARVGGDEFIIVLEDLGGSDDAALVARALLEALHDPFEIAQHEVRASASIGIAVYPQHGDAADELRRNADQALYRAKRSGRDQFRMFDTHQPESPDAMDIQSALQSAIEDRALVLHYQPIFAHDGRIRALEALLRFHHSRLGLLPPHRFISIAEDTGLIVAIGEWVIEEACRQAMGWRVQGLPEVTVNVNVSALQFARSDFADAVARVLERTGHEPRLLELELTETVVMSNVEESARQMERLKSLGVKIAVDDFGTGYSSLSYLHRLPLDTLKIDRSFTEKIAEPGGTRPIVEAILSLAATLHMRTVAEGIETDSQFRMTQRLGCDLVQGYLLSRPVPSSEIPALLSMQQTTTSMQ